MKVQVATNSQHAEDLSRESLSAHSLNGESLYQAIKKGEISSAEISIQEHFQLASDCAVRGELTKKNEVLSWVLTHPHREPADIQRVEINRADWQRRSGAPLFGLSILNQMEPLPNIFNQLEYMQAVGQCLLQLARTNPHVIDRLAYLTRAVKAQDTLAALAAASSEVPEDKKLYYWIGVAEHRTALMRERKEHSDINVEEALEKCRKIVEAGQVRGAYASRVAWELPFGEGRYLYACERFDVAARSFAKSWENLVNHSDLRAKTAVALSFIASAAKGECGKESKSFIETGLFLREVGRSHLLPGDLPLFAEVIAEAEKGLGAVLLS